MVRAAAAGTRTQRSSHPPRPTCRSTITHRLGWSIGRSFASHGFCWLIGRSSNAPNIRSIRGSPRADTTSFVVVGDKHTMAVRTAISSGQYNVVTHRWVLRCIEEGEYSFPEFHEVCTESGKG